MHLPLAYPLPALLQYLPYLPQKVRLLHLLPELLLHPYQQALPQPELPEQLFHPLFQEQLLLPEPLLSFPAHLKVLPLLRLGLPVRHLLHRIHKNHIRSSYCK